jgi:hypothetical protein
MNANETQIPRLAVVLTLSGDLPWIYVIPSILGGVVVGK